MLSTALIVFREILEAALVVSIVMAATKTVAGRGFWVGGGLFGGILGACLVAAFASVIGAWASGMGQEVFNAAIMFTAVVMLAWHSIWMGRHGREMAQHLGAVGKAVTAGSKSLSGLAIVVGVAVLREGSELVLFLYGIAAGDPGQAGPMMLGGLLGGIGGVGLGAAMYYGLLQISTRHLFSITNGLIILLAAGMTSQGIGYLLAADLLPAWGDTIWDTSWLLADTSIVGKMLHALIGYTARPAGIQIAGYLATLCLIVLMVRQFGKPAAQPRIHQN
ncbi:FTR1 family iron permease [Paraherbaspirillum soli]|uniref:FTR1 family protein n=1 Tax=Paraherbaspirillum soli TaxID=631222 RepID=A0ABW0MDX0_9BURK